MKCISRIEPFIRRLHLLSSRSGALSYLNSVNTTLQTLYYELEYSKVNTITGINCIENRVFLMLIIRGGEQSGQKWLKKGYSPVHSAIWVVQSGLLPHFKLLKKLSYYLYLD